MPTFEHQHRTAVLASVDIVAAVGPADLGLATPCAGWTLADLLTHMTAQHHGFAASARGRGADPDVWRPERFAAAVNTDPSGTYAAAANDVLAAFTADGVALSVEVESVSGVAASVADTAASADPADVVDSASGADAGMADSAGGVVPSAVVSVDPACCSAGAEPA